jgi:hypothetical protein
MPNLTTAEFRRIAPDQAAEMGLGPAKVRRARGEAKAERIRKRDARDAEHRRVESGLDRVQDVFAATVYAETPNPLNGSHSSHWTVSKTRRAQRKAMAEALLVYSRRRPALPALVTVTRCSRRLLDGDGLAAALKSIQDEIADWLNVDDGDRKNVDFVRMQEHGSYCVRVDIRPATGGAA